MKEINALVFAGYGINCEKEVAIACEMVGFNVQSMHVQKILNGQIDLDAFHFIIFPGGFSFGDELGAGKVFANRLTFIRLESMRCLREHLSHFVDRGGCILGICNGFQLLVKLGLLPGFDKNFSQTISLSNNDSCRFESRWVRHKVVSSRSIFTKDLHEIELPIRHGEGKFVARDASILKRIYDQNQVVLQYSTTEGEPAKQYPENPNGSVDAIGGICDHTGRILGMMAHPEAALFFTQHPQWLRKKEDLRRRQESMPKYGSGIALFKNAIDYLRDN